MKKSMKSLSYELFPLAGFAAKMPIKVKLKLWKIYDLCFIMYIKDLHWVINMIPKRAFMTLICIILLVSAGCSSVPIATLSQAPTSYPASTQIPTITFTPSPTQQQKQTPVVTMTPSANPTDSTNPNDRITVPDGISPLTGLPMDDYRPVVVIIENTQEAYPQYGLSQADVVLEIPVEGSITRLASIFNTNRPKQVGPVRSMRLQILRALAEYQPMLSVHFGGANGDDNEMQIYNRFKEFNMELREDFTKSGKPYWRSNDRIAPHNAFTTIPGLLDRHSGDYKGPSVYRPFPYGTQAPEGGDVKTIKLAYRSTNKVEYRYDKKSGAYSRFLNGVAMKDALTKKQIAVTNIIVPVYTFTHKPNKYGDYIDINFIGEGPCDLFVGGKHVAGKWIKKEKFSRTRYCDSQGNEVQLLPGNTWIQVRDDKIALTYK